MDRRRRVAALSGATAAIAGGWSVLSRPHQPGGGSHWDFLIGLSVGVTIAVAILLMAKWRKSAAGQG